jgi:isopropylmalate/homocitrate/citramalate synthase
MTERERLYLYDTTLRDGQQTQGVQFSTADKLAIARALDELGDRLHRGRLARRQSDRQRVLRRRPAYPRHAHRLRHDQARRAVGGE